MVLLLIGALAIGIVGIYLMLFPEWRPFQRAGNRGLDSNYAGTPSCREINLATSLASSPATRLR